MMNTEKNILALMRRAKQHYPQSRKMRRQWVRQTFDLYHRGKHALQTGGFKAGTY